MEIHLPYIMKSGDEILVSFTDGIRAIKCNDAILLVSGDDIIIDTFSTENEFNFWIDSL